MKNKNWVPEILYEETENGGSSALPFIMVPDNELMPRLLYIWESKDTGRYEPNDVGNPVPVFEWDLHQYADMLFLKKHLDPNIYDKVRLALGLEKLADAVKSGSENTEKIRNNLED
tara:strand:- start:181 stop:528 length:348 start_codon:yes stop_codon:yes gene_type:complete